MAVAVLLSGTGARSADIANTTPFANFGPFSGDVISNRSTINNSGAGIWTGNIQSNGNPADPLPAVGANGSIANNAGATWNGDVNGNSDLVINYGSWNGNINGNANFVLNNAGVWTGNVVGNSGYGQNTQVFNGGNGTWIGDVVGNNAFIGNDGIWQGSVLANSRTMQNSGTWTGNVVSNSVNIYNNTGVWIGDVQANTGKIQNEAASQWVGNVTANTGTINNIGTWTGNVTSTGIVNNTGSISGITTVNGGTLTGNGTLASVVVGTGGTFAPGSGAGTIATVTNNLTLQSGAFYSVSLNPTTASFASVTGSAALGGATVQATFASGSYVAKQYSILTAAGGLGGSTFASVVETNLPFGFKTALRYDATHAYLDLSLALIPPSGPALGGNQQAVGNALVNYFDATGSIPMVFAGLNASTLSQASGQPGASSAQGAISGVGQFFNAVFDGAFDASSGQGDAIGFAAEDAQSSAYAATRWPAPKATEAYAAVTPRDRVGPSFVSRWNVWGSVYGGNSRTSGDAIAGTTTTTSRIFGAVAGARYRFSPDTLAGFALGGAGSSFGLDAGLGGGKADVFNAVIYAKHNVGAAYLAGLIGYSWQDTTTDRTVTIAGTDQLHASFKAQAASARLESGWRFATPLIGITPYAALQAITYYQPSYGETATSGNNTFALSYAAKTVTATRGEIGARFDRVMSVQNGVFTLKARTAWAHDWNGDRSATATFQTLPGATFVVNGATPSADAALLSLGSEMRWMNGWSVAANLDGEFSRTTTSYAGRGSLRYAW